MSSDSEPKKPSPSKPAYDKTTQIIGTSVDVAAASAMLELSSSGQHRKLSVEKESTPKSISMQYSLASPSRSQVVPLDSSHRLFKWTFDSSSYIISASGTQEIRMLETMLEKGADRQQVVHGLVKMKYRYEEKLDIQERVKRDLEAELDQVKTSKKQRLNEAVETRKALQHEMDLLRNEQSNRSKDVNDALFKIWQQVGDLKRERCNEITEVDMNNIKTSVLETIEKQVKEQEKMTDQLRVELELERSKRLEAESKLNEMLDGLHGRLPFLMDGHVSNMIRESQKLGEENNLRPSFSRKSLQSLTSLSKKNQESEEYLDVT
uniref:Uncharacterized protein n=1 Tax=Ciona savignyi TaxID=51511 RepID=H2Y5U1_CIOSA